MRTLLLLLVAFTASAQPARRALLIGIDDYTASTIPIAHSVQHRGWPDLRGAANDVAILADMLVLRYGFERKNVVTLTNQQATRAAILRSIETHLVRTAHKDDVVFYYFAGHGAQVPNAASDEPDRLDESIVPADSRRGAPDIRDKELRPLFNRILARGAHLTLLLDHCHSAGGFRGRPARGIAPAPPIRDATNYGPRPDERGALVLASAQDFDTAWETRGDDGRMHGAFTWAWIRAMRDAVAGETAEETFLRAQARLRAETPFQSPALLGDATSRHTPFLGTTSHEVRTVIAVEAVHDDEVVLQGGWAHNLAIGTELSPIDDPTTHLRITRLLGLGRSVAHADDASAIRSGTLLQVARWSAPEERPLRVYGEASMDGVVAVRDPRDADYILTRRANESAWLRRGNNRSLPPQTSWTSDATQLRRDLVTLRRIHGWLSLSSPASPAPYHLTVRDEQTSQLVHDGIVIGDRVCSIVLRAPSPPTSARYYYVFVLDTLGNSHLVFPKTGSAENRFPLANTAPLEIPLGRPSAFRIAPPYGVDTYILLSTEEPLPNPGILEWDGVRARRALGVTAWSIERVTLESVAPPRRRASAGRVAPRAR
ncbi:MAG TPA: caspase family protein [Thermoanaerobaculia bacterium]|nr:caspase family protein [Thermoanaerobaculia bacterium]